MPRPPEELVFVGDGDFELVGKLLLDLLVGAGLEPSHDVLDIGCGIGRVAVPLTGYLLPGSRYEGFDVVRAGIDWCRENVGSQHPNFRFSLADLRNTHYNPDGSLPAPEFVFPYEDRSFDFAFATSVFTHVLPETLRRYLHETRRVLRGGGILLSTFFLINEAALARGSQFVRCGDHYSGDPADPEQTTAYDEERVLAEIAGAGLSVEEVRAGTWPAEAGGFYQDVVIARRPVESGWRRLRGSLARRPARG